MKIRIKGTTLKLNNREVASCKRVISSIIDKLQEKTDKNLSPTYFFTFLIIMHVMSQSILNEFDEKTLAEIMSKLRTEE